MNNNRPNILVTGMGEPAARSAGRALSRLDVNVLGIGDASVDDLLAACHHHRVDVVVPTVDSQLMPLAESQARFRRIGVRVLVASPQALRISQDGVFLFRALNGDIPMPRTEVFGRDFDPVSWRLPLVLKTRTRRRRRPIRVVRKRKVLYRARRSPHVVIQEYLPGDEYVVDVVAAPDGQTVVTLPAQRCAPRRYGSIRQSMEAMSELPKLARRTIELIRLHYLSRLTFRRDRTGILRLVSVVARVPDGLDSNLSAGTDLLRHSLGLLGRPVRRVRGMSPYSHAALHSAPSKSVSA